MRAQGHGNAKQIPTMEKSDVGVDHHHRAHLCHT